MMRRRFVFSCFSLVALSLFASTPANAQNGVRVDADGVLRTLVFLDPTGALTRRRIAEARAKLNADVMRPSDLRKVSINRLEEAMARRLQAGQQPTDEMRYLAGLTNVQYVFFYPETNDIVIAGPAEGYMDDLSGRPVGIHTGQAVMELQDLIVALRAFPATGEKTRLISVSIDPTQQGLARMQQFLVAVQGRVRPSDAQRIAIGLRRSLGPQTVSVKGISPRTHFAQVLVEADYRMKLIGIGLERPPVNIPSFISRAKPGSVSRNALQRWYFTPDYERVRVSADNFAMELEGNGVQLMSEDQLVTALGGRVKSGTVNAASRIFTQAFTNKYPELAMKAPVYAQLRNLINLSIAAAFIQKKDLYGKSGWDMGVFANEDGYAVETYHAPKTVECAVNVVWKGSTLMTPIGGGVNIQPRIALNSDRVLPDEQGKVDTARKQIRIDNLAPGQWWWD